MKMCPKCYAATRAAQEPTLCREHEEGDSDQRPVRRRPETLSELEDETSRLRQLAIERGLDAKERYYLGALDAIRWIQRNL